MSGFKMAPSFSVKLPCNPAFFLQCRLINEAQIANFGNFGDFGNS
jgi:hypothetical protein